MAAEANEAGGQEVRVLRAEVQQVRAQITEATAAAEQNASRLREEIERLRAELEHERSRKFMHRVVDAAQGAKTLRAEIGQLRTQLTEANQAIEQERGDLEASMGELRAELEFERSRGFFRKLFGLRPRPAENPEDTREKMRGRLGVTLVWTLIAVVVGTYAYLLISNLSPQDLNTVVPMVGATLLTPLVGLIGAVMGFYYGGQTAVQAASQTAEATRTAAQAATTVQSATAAQITARTAADMYAQTAAQMTNGANGTNRPLGSSTVRSQNQPRRGGTSSNSH